MTESNASESPIKAAADMTEASATEAFSLLGNETRLAILLALWEAFVPFAGETWDPTDGNAVSFSELYDRVEYDTTANFSYHLEKLEGQFVHKSTDGYELLPAGHKIVRTIIGTAGFEETLLPPTEIDKGCSNCGAPIEITYQNQRLYYLCTECGGNVALGDEHPSNVLGAEITNPRAVKDRGPEAIYAAVRTETFYDQAKRVAGICPVCSGRVDRTLDVCDAHTPRDEEPCPACGRQSEWRVRFVCRGCKHAASETVTGLSLRHPAVIGFGWEHGRELGYNSHETASFFLNLHKNVEEELVSREPPRIRVTIRYEGDELRLTFDEELNVVEANRSD